MASGSDTGTEPGTDPDTGTTTGAEATAGSGTERGTDTGSDTTSTSTTTTTTSAGNDDGNDGDDGGDDGSESTSGAEEPVRVDDGVVVLYLFDEGGGSTVRDRSGVSPAIDLALSGGGFYWSDGDLITDGSGIASSNTAPDKVYDACTASEELTLEAWVTPAFSSTAPPGRIVAYSPDNLSRNFHLAQGRFNNDGTGFTARVRTTATDSNGFPDTFANLTAPTVQTHLVYTRTASGRDTFYLDGSRVTVLQQPGSMSVWDPSYRLAVGNDRNLGNPFTGALHLIAIYCRALDEDEVLRNFEAGPL